MPENRQDNGAFSICAAVTGSILLGVGVGLGIKSVVAGIWVAIGVFFCLASINVYIDGAVNRLNKKR